MRTRDGLLAFAVLAIGCAESLGVDEDQGPLSHEGGAGAAARDGAAGSNSDSGGGGADSASGGEGGSYISSAGAFGDGGSAGEDDGRAAGGASGESGQSGASSADAGADAPPGACDDEIANGDETDVDCGGGACPPCAADKSCETSSDCVSTVCTAKVCAPPPACALPASCTCGYHAGRAYAFCTTGKAWAAARSDCESAGMKLVRIDDAGENTWVRTTAWQKGLTDSWLGAADSAVEADWKWSDGVSFWNGSSSGAPVGGRYTAWNTNEPNNIIDQDCAHYFGSEKWADDWCGSSRPFVCEDY